jgi:hypothetical protein
MISKMELWDRAFKTNPDFVKQITGKDYGGVSPSPYYIVKRLTEEFGPCGHGWGIKILSERMERMGPDDVLHIAHISLWYMLDGQRCETEQVGQTKACYRTKGEKGYLKVDEDAPKKSVTDAFVKCASYLGFAGDIFSGRWDDSKYVAELRKEFEDAEEEEAEPMQESRIADWITIINEQTSGKSVAGKLADAKTACMNMSSPKAYERIVAAAKARALVLKPTQKETA